MRLIFFGLGEEATKKWKKFRYLPCRPCRRIAVVVRTRALPRLMQAKPFPLQVCDFYNIPKGMVSGCSRWCQASWLRLCDLQRIEGRGG